MVSGQERVEGSHYMYKTIMEFLKCYSLPRSPELPFYLQSYSSSQPPGSQSCYLLSAREIKHFCPKVVLINHRQEAQLWYFNITSHVTWSGSQGPMKVTPITCSVPWVIDIQHSVWILTNMQWKLLSWTSTVWSCKVEHQCIWYTTITQRVSHWPKMGWSIYNLKRLRTLHVSTV